MKKLFSVILLGGIISFFPSFSEKKFKPEGFWKVVNKTEQEDEKIITFYADGKMRMRSTKDSLQSTDLAYRYKFDFDKKPAWFDLNIYNMAGDKIAVFEGIVDIKSSNEFILLLSKRSRPKSFEEKDASEMRFTRINK